MANIAALKDGSALDANIITAAILGALVRSGWIDIVQTWTYASASTFTISGDQTGLLQPGMWIRYKQGGAYKYGKIVLVSYSSPNTTVTIQGEALTATGITDNAYSTAHSPLGINGDKFWATLISTGAGLTTQATTAISNHPSLTVNKIDGNAVGTKGTADTWGIMGGFDFVCTETGYYELEAVASMTQLQNGGAGVAGFIDITQDTSNPAQNNDSTSDGGTEMSASFAGATCPGGSWADTINLKSMPSPVLLTKGTHYYFTVRNKYQGGAAATAFNISSLSGSGITLKIRRL
mgnify:CR=1 FL=1